jgi:eukaryotic-like serine/threonine-protein kinase
MCPSTWSACPSTESEVVNSSEAYGSGATTPSLPPSVRIGDVIADKYRLDRIRGAGGMGVVVEALHLHLGRPIAIKFMSPVLRGNHRGMGRFMLEARATARIQSEHVVRVFDVASLGDGTPYIVMEYLEGEDLREVLQKHGRLAVGEAVDYVLQACDGVAEAHGMGVVHRDLKPDNLFCCSRPHASPLIKVLDFGVSKLLPTAVIALGSERTTGSHVMLGSPVYSSPEQLCEPQNVDARADVWALGAILYELVVGRPPFAADSVVELCAKVLGADVEPLRALRPEVPVELEAVIGRCLAKDRELRFGTVSELAEALAPFAPRRPMASRASVPESAPADLRATSRRRVPRSRAIGWCLATAVGAALLGGWASSSARSGGPMVTVPDVARASELPRAEMPPPTRDPVGPSPSEPAAVESAASAAPAPTTARPAPAMQWSLPRAVDVHLRPKRAEPPITAAR